MKCLIVEDDEFVRELMVLHLSDYAEIDTATDGVQGVASFTTALQSGTPYHLVCLDIQMPNMNGLQALKEMRLLERKHIGLTHKAVIIMTTASTDLADIEEALWQGESTDYLVKPVHPDDLQAVLKKYLLIGQ